MTSAIQMMRLAGVGALFLTAACGEDEPMPAPGTGSDAGSPCAQWADLASAVGCPPPDDCQVLPACATEAAHWMDCIEQDLSQCLCESDGDLSCEGSYKPNEGPALCIPELTAFDACIEPAM